MITFFLPITPRPKGNSKRILRAGRGGRPFVAGKAAHVKAEQDVVLLASRHKPPRPIEGPVRLDVIFVMPIPPSWSRRKRELATAGALLPTSSPDRGNLLKLIEDALQKAGFYHDDAQVVGGRVEKNYGRTPGYYVTIDYVGFKAQGAPAPEQDAGA